MGGRHFLDYELFFKLARDLISANLPVRTRRPRGGCVRSRKRHRIDRHAFIVEWLVTGYDDAWAMTIAWRAFGNLTKPANAANKAVNDPTNLTNAASSTNPATKAAKAAKVSTSDAVTTATPRNRTDSGKERGRTGRAGSPPPAPTPGMGAGLRAHRPLAKSYPSHHTRTHVPSIAIGTPTRTATLNPGVVQSFWVSMDPPRVRRITAHGVHCTCGARPPNKVALNATHDSPNRPRQVLAGRCKAGREAVQPWKGRARARAHRGKGSASATTASRGTQGGSKKKPSGGPPRDSASQPTRTAIPHGGALHVQVVVLTESSLTPTHLALNGPCQRPDELVREAVREVRC